MKHILYAFLSTALFLFYAVSSFAQGNTCAEVAPFCSDLGVTFPAGVNVPAASESEPGNNYNCLGSSPNPAWYYLEIAVPGNINILLTNSNSVDIDFALWGPFPNATIANQNCGSLGTTVDCSFSAAPIETVSIPDAEVGQVYILLITNYSNIPTNINAQQNGGTGATDCDIVLCDLEAIPSANNPVCSGSAIQLTGNASSQGASVAYAWTGPNGFTSTEQNPIIPNATAATGGAYSLVVTEGECTSDPVTVDVPISDYTVSITNSLPTCVGNIVVFSANPTPATVIGANYNYIWAGPNNFTANDQSPAIFDITSANSGVYTVSISAGNCATQTASTTIVVTQPKAVATADSLVCVGGTLHLSADITPSNESATYTWTGPNGYSSSVGDDELTNFDESKAGLYLLTGNVGDCVVESDTVVVSSFSIEASATQVASMCGGANTAQALAAATDATPPLSFVWSTGATNATASDLAVGVYTVTITDANSCHSNTSITISSFPAPTTSIGGEFDFCEGAAANLHAGSFVSYIWSTGETTQSIAPNTANTYTVTITDSNGCTATDEADVIQNSVVTPTITGNLLVLPKNGTVLSINENYVTYAWSNGAVTKSNSVSEGGIYGVTVSDSNNCTSTNSVTVTKLNVAIPNAFSPNNDGANDVFRLNFPPEYVTQYELSVFDRWGQKVFSTTNLSDGWDGTNKSFASPMGVYAYILKIAFNDAIEETYRGNVSLMR